MIFIFFPKNENNLLQIEIILMIIDIAVFSFYNVIYRKENKHKRSAVF